MNVRTDRDDVNSERIFRGLKRGGIDFVTSVPCVKLGPLLKLISDDPDVVHVPVTREEEGVGVCAGAYMGGKRPAILMQNSGLGNSVNALTSLNMLYGIPLLMIISHRGTMGEKVDGQVPMGKATVPLLDAIGIEHWSPDPVDSEDRVAKAAATASRERKPVALLFDLEYWRCRS
ncbi:MAG TPA: sulfopyruvate decarboxylase subunit alpha [Methanomassiliicoccales archaeon]|jgi:sulfopyruvate decarboxylase subunit alpha